MSFKNSTKFQVICAAFALGIALGTPAAFGQGMVDELTLPQEMVQEMQAAQDHPSAPSMAGEADVNPLDDEATQGNGRLFKGTPMMLYRSTPPGYSWRFENGEWIYYTRGGQRWDTDKRQSLGYDGHAQAVSEGMDVSEHNGKIDWKTVKNSYIDFAFVRVADGNFIHKRVDYTFDRNMKLANKYDLPVGVYIYSRALTPDQAKKEAQFAIEHAKKYKVDLPIVIDVEETYTDATYVGRTQCQQGLSSQALTDIINAFSTEVIKAGYTPMLYTSESWLASEMYPSQFSSQLQKWVAGWSCVAPATVKCDVWQCSATGAVPGIQNSVDINFAFNKQYASSDTSDTSDTTGTAGLIHEDSKIKFKYKDGSFAKSSWVSYQGSWYYFDKNGYGVSGIQKISYNGKDELFYFNANGTLKHGWISQGSNWYYANTSSGILQTGWLKISGSWYYFDANQDRAMVRGKQTISGYDYYFKSSGALSFGKCTIDGVDYVANPQTGILSKVEQLKGWTEDGLKYTDSNTGDYIVGWKKIDGKWFVFDNAALVRRGWIAYGNSWCFGARTGQPGEKGALVTGWHVIDGVTYWFDADGIMARGWTKINGSWYIFKSNGALKTGWISYGNSWCYGAKSNRVSEAGKMLHGWQTIDGVVYWFDEGGVAARGWTKIDGSWYIFKSNSALKTGWIAFDGSWCYGKTSGDYKTMGTMTIGWKQIDGQWFYFNSDGVAVSNWKFIDGQWYIFNQDCSLKSGWVKYGSSWYYAWPSNSGHTHGTLAVGTHTIDGSTYTFNSVGALI